MSEEDDEACLLDKHTIDNSRTTTPCCDVTSLPCKSSFQDRVEQARDDLTWKDPYYDDKQGIVAVFDCQDSEIATEWLKSVKTSVAIYWFVACVFYAALYTFWEAEHGETGWTKLFRSVLYALPLLGVIYLARGYYFDYSSVVASLCQDHVAVTTEGVRFDSGYTSTCIPFSCIQSVEQRSLVPPKTDPELQGVMLSRTRRDFEKTCGTAMFGANETVRYWLRIEKRQEFVDLVIAMKKVHEFKAQQDEDVIAVDEGGHQDCTTSSCDATSLLLRKSIFQDIEEARDLTWEDPYYDDKQGIVAVFDCQDAEIATEWIRSQRVGAAIYWYMACLLYGSLALWEAEQGETGVAKYYGWALGAGLLLGALNLVRGGFQFNYDLIQARLLQDHVAVTTEGVRRDSGYTSTHIPFSSIRSVEQRSLVPPKTDPELQGVMLSRTRRDFEKTCCTAIFGVNEYAGYWLRIEKRQEFVDLVMAMKEAHGFKELEG